MAFRGGTALHKLYIRDQVRYSEDIDLVQVKPGPIKPILQRIKEVVTFFEEERVVKQKMHNNTILYRFTSEYGVNRMRLKLEINCKEHFNVKDWVKYPYSINSRWFSGQTSINTYHIHELLGTKLRALYQRKKGRDLFDLYYAGQNLDLNYEDIINSFVTYIKFSTGRIPTKKQFLLNMEEKRSSLLFKGDMEGILKNGISYDEEKAFDWLITEIIEMM